MSQRNEPALRFVRCAVRAMCSLSQLAEEPAGLRAALFHRVAVGRRFPGIDALKPNEQLLVISDEGSVYRGAHAWIMCLWALRKYREHAQRLASPTLLPFAQIVCELLSRNRFHLSEALFRQRQLRAAGLLAGRNRCRKGSCCNAAASS